MNFKDNFNFFMNIFLVIMGIFIVIRFDYEIIYIFYVFMRFVCLLVDYLVYVMFMSIICVIFFINILWKYSYDNGNFL